MVYILAVLPEAVIEFIVEFFVRHDGDRVRLNNTCSFLRSLCPKDVCLKVPLSKFIASPDELLWAYENGAKSLQVAEYASQMGYRKIIEAIISGGENPTDVKFEFLVHYAFIFGQTETAKWLIALGFEWMKNADLDVAAIQGDIEMIEWICEQGGKFDSGTAEKAVAYGGIDVLKWLKNHGCQFSDGICDRAVSTGNIEMVQWLLSEGYPWSRRAFIYTCGSKKMREFLVSLTR